MTVRHLFPASEPLIAKHIQMLGNKDDGAVTDIIHVHGCWDYDIIREAMKAYRQGARIVFTPHGGLEPWVISDRRMSERLNKLMLWQRRLVKRSYVVIAQGNIEAESMRQLGWNPRIEIIRNAVVTKSITPEAMTRQTQEVYRKVMDSNTYELMGEDTRKLMTFLLKAGITGDERWIDSEPPYIEEDEWRKLLIYANHENIRTTIDKGARVLGIHHPYIETEKIKSYLPTAYKLPTVESHDVVGMIGEMRHNPLTLRHFVELDHALRKDDIDDEWLCDTLDENHHLKFFRRLLQMLTEITGLDEGFLPARPIDDRQTQSLRMMLTKHLRI